VQRNPSGTVIETFPDGKKIQTMQDGSRIELYPDGRRIDVSATGDVLERLADGTEIRKKLRTANSITCWKCATMVSVPMAKFIFCCPMCRSILIASKKESEENLQGQERQAADCRAAFNYFNKKGDGQLDSNNLGEMLGQLNFGAEAFPEIFTAADENKDGRLSYQEFASYWELLQKKMVETASAPMVEMTRDLLEKQKAELNKERLRLEAQNAELSKRLATDAGAKAELESAEAKLKAINSEFQSKEKQMNETMNEQRRRQKSFLKDRLAKRKAAAAQAAGKK